jgi:GNAT superfamily N-acetyltransferase
MPITFESVAAEDLVEEKSRHRATVTTPQDAYWENGIIGVSAHYAIFDDSAPAGFCAVDGDGFLVQLFANQGEQRLLGMLDACIVSLGIHGAFAATNEPAFLDACRVRGLTETEHTLLYFDEQTVAPSGEHTLRPAVTDDVTALVAISGADASVDLATMEAGFGGLAGYVSAAITDGSIFVLEHDGEIAGSGDFRLRNTWPGTADLGVVVAPHLQGRGLGTEVLRLLKQMAAAIGAEPMCSTTVENLASQRMIAKSGMAVRHRIMRIQF